MLYSNPKSWKLQTNSNLLNIIVLLEGEIQKYHNYYMENIFWTPSTWLTRWGWEHNCPIICLLSVHRLTRWDWEHNCPIICLLSAHRVKVAKRTARLISSRHSPAPPRVNPSPEILSGTPGFSRLLSDFKSFLENGNHRLPFNKKTLSMQSRSWLYEYLWSSQSWILCFRAARLPKGLLCFPVCTMKPPDDAVFQPELWLACS